MRAMTLVAGVLSLSVQCVWAEVSRTSSSASTSDLHPLVSTGRAMGAATPEAAATPFTNSHDANNTSSHLSTHGAGRTQSTPHPHLVTLSSTTFTRRPPRPTPQPPSPEQAPHAAPPPRPRPPPRRPHRGTSGGTIVGIVFGVLGGLIGFFALVALGRCVHSWRRTPAADTIATTLDRHYLEREMAERGREDIERRVLASVPTPVREAMKPPPPPYVPAPAYDAIIDASGPSAHASASSSAPVTEQMSPPTPSHLLLVSQPIPSSPPPPPSPRSPVAQHDVLPP